MECTLIINEPHTEFNGTLLTKHSSQFYFSLYDEKENLVRLPIPILDEQGNTIGISAQTKIASNANQEIHLNFPLKSGFYTMKVFFEDTFQNGIIFQRVTIS